MHENHNLRTYTVTPRGIITRVGASGGPELHFLALLSKSTGCGVEKRVVVRNNRSHPTLVDDVEAAFRRNRNLRLVLQFRSIPDLTGPMPAIRSVAEIESILGVRPKDGNGQMDLFA